LDFALCYLSSLNTKKGASSSPRFTEDDISVVIAVGKSYITKHELFAF